MTLRGSFCLLIAAARPCFGNGTDATHGDPSRIRELVALNDAPFEGLSVMDAAEIRGESMTLTGPEDRSMRFRSAD